MTVKFESILSFVQELRVQHPEWIEEFSKRLGLQFLDESNRDGNLCFVNNEEVRSDFKESFTSIDIAYYLFGLIQTSSLPQTSLIEFQLTFPYPADSERFWNIAELGQAQVSKY